MRNGKLRINPGQLLMATLLMGVLYMPACKPTSTIPPEGTKVTSNSEVFKRAASELQQDCERMGGCRCYMDGLRTKCSFVFACLDAGFCVLVKGDE